MARDIGRMALMIGTWAFVYALPAVPLEGLPNLGVRLPAWAYAVDMWPQALAIPGVIAGALFVLLLGATRHVRDLEQQPTSRLLLWGALAGIAAGGVVLALVGGEQLGVSAVIVVGATMLGALAAPASAYVLRLLARRRHSPTGARA